MPPPAGVVAAGVRWVGRVDTTSEPTHPRFSWSGSGFVARFEGTSLSAALYITGTSAIFKAVVDGTPQAPFTANPGTTTFMLASGLAAGVHTVELYRQTEGPQGESRLFSLDVGTGTLMDPPAGASRLIEVVGDSITCGYGILGALADSDCYPTESHWDTYAALAGRALGAEVSTIAASGRGVVRNYGGDTSGTMPMLYPRAVTNVAGRSGTSTSSRRRSSSTWAPTTSATGRAIPATPSATRTGRCSRPCARTTRTRSSSASSRRC